MNVVIFDLDGTLLDTIKDIADSMNSVLQKYGLPQQKKEMNHWIIFYLRVRPDLVKQHLV